MSLSGLRTLWLAERFPPQRGGVARSAARQAKALAERVERLDVLVLDEALPPGRAEAEAHGKAVLHRLGRAPREDESCQLLLEAALALARAQRHQALLGFYAVWSGYVAALAARRLGLPSLVSLRGNDVDRGLFEPARVAPLRWTLESATALLPVTRELAERAQAFVGPRENVFVVPNSVDAGVFCPGAAAALGAAERPWIGFSGEARLKKGLPVLLDLAEELHRRGAGAVFLIGGARGEERRRLETWRRESPASARLVELPYVADDEELARRYRAMDVVVFPSLWDGLPNAALEAMGCARPIVAAASGGLLDAVEEGRTGRLVPAHELDGFADAVLDLWRSLESRERLGAGARAAALERFSPEAELAALARAYEAVL